MAEPRQQTARYAVSVCGTATVAGEFDSVKALEEAVVAVARTAAQLYQQAFGVFQEAWLAAHRPRFTAQRWRTIHWLTPFGQVSLPVRVLYDRLNDRYLTLSKVLFRHKATRLLSPALERQACAPATEQTDRHAARSLCRWIGTRLGPWLVWACVQYYGARRPVELDKAPLLAAQPSVL